MKIAKHRGMARVLWRSRKLAAIPHRMWADGGRVPLRQGEGRGGGRSCCLRGAKRREEPSLFAREGDPDRSRGDDGQGDLVESPSPPAQAGEVVKQIETPRLPDPIMQPTAKRSV